MRGLCLILFAAYAVSENGGAVSAADEELESTKDKKKDEKLIQGTWTVVFRELNGQKTPEAELKGGKIIIKEGTMTSDDGKKKEKVASYKLDPSKTPRAIDVISDEDGKKVVTAGIYELDGDTLKICWSERFPDRRPIKFASDADSGQTVVVLKREKKQ